jgi:hypothetical protein
MTGRACVYVRRRLSPSLFLAGWVVGGGVGIKLCRSGEAGADGVLVDVVAAGLEVGTIDDEVVSIAALPDGEF